MDKFKSAIIELKKYCGEKNAYLFKENIQISFSQNNRLIQLYKTRLQDKKQIPFARIKMKNDLWDLYYKKDNSWISPKEYQQISSIIQALIQLEQDNLKLFW